jgi:phosphoribosylaminoimidazolecarboxamide formyltransferase/IMP cyclohydrolase
MRALLSVHDKTGLEGFARGLRLLRVELIASGNTAAMLRGAGIDHLRVEEVTGSPEMLSGRVKTLHPRIHGAILADLDEPSHVLDLANQAIEPIGLVVCNLYPFRAAPSVETIDIGGPTLLRAAAKNHAHVTVVVDAADYGHVLDELRREGEIGPRTRLRLARTAFAHVAAYDAAIVDWFDEAPASGADPLPATIHVALEKIEELRYGENPHQRGARYRSIGAPPGSFDRAVQHGGRELSYLNLFDADAAWRLVHEVGSRGWAAAAAIVKHANPCGVAVGSDVASAYGRAFEADPLSAFGGVVALNGPVDGALAELIAAKPLADVLVAPAFDAKALECFAARRKNMRVLEMPPPGEPRLSMRQIDGGWLVQQPDRLTTTPAEWRVVTKAAPTKDQWQDLELAWLVCARSTSNAVVMAAGGQVNGVGCGQQSRVEAASMAARKAAGRAEGGAAASDAFFPFRDGLEAVAAAGVLAVVQPGGSLRDDEVVAAADELGMAMVLTGERHFRH